jgi:murein DD-endopeptidase MepM/ murein hydrolase activator NlpD
MFDLKTVIQRYGGHIILLLVAIILFIGARSNTAYRLLNRGSASETEFSKARIYEEVPEAPDFITDVSAIRNINLDNVPVLADGSLSPNLNPLTYQGKLPVHEFSTYTVQPNDTPIGIAEQFGIKTETLLGGNPFLSEESSALQAGTELLMLPVDGVLHEVVDGDSLEGLAQVYGVPVEDIIGYQPNNLEFPFRLYPETQIMVPGAVKEVFVWSAPSLPSRPSTSDSTGSGIAPLVQGTGTFVWPVGYRRITQQYWYGHPAIDVGMPQGSPVVAADTGTVTWAGWNVYGYGNLVVINHGNGYETYYAHLSGIGVQPGQVVNQGQYIGASGNTGRSSGPHLHVEIRYFNSTLSPLGILR